MPILSFSEDASRAELPGHFVGQNYAAGGRTGYDLDVLRAEVIGHHCRQPLGMLRPLQHQELFEVTAAVAPGGQQKMPVQDGPCLLEDGENAIVTAAACAQGCLLQMPSQLPQAACSWATIW